GKVPLPIEPKPIITIGPPMRPWRAQVVVTRTSYRRHPQRTTPRLNSSGPAQVNRAARDRRNGSRG
ncbi:MAG: hypothetical protein ACJ8CC_21060, partial [Microvirga sp.]